MISLGLQAAGISKGKADVASGYTDAAFGLALSAGTGYYRTPSDATRLASATQRTTLAESKTPQYVNLASEQRTVHILAGDATGGGHAWFASWKSFTNGILGKKTMFPMNWSGEKIMNAVSDVAVNNPWVQQTGRAGATVTRSGQPVRYVVTGVYEGVKLKVVTNLRI